MDKKHYQLLILGSGPAGCTAAIYAARANLNVAMITGLEQGGQITKAPKIANWPGEVTEVSGVSLMEKMMNQVRKFKAEVLLDSINEADLFKHPFYLKGTEFEYSCDALIIAMGASARFLGLSSEQKYMGKGVSSCAVCDGFFYKNRDVVVVGGGNTMAEEALYLAKIAQTVTIVHRRDSLRAEEHLVDQLKKTPNIKWELNYVVSEILGDEQNVTGVLIKNVDSNATKEIKAQGVFIAVGYEPNTEIFFDQLEMEQNYIKVGYNFATATSIPGVFAAGDIVSRNYHQAIVAAGTGCSAALDAKKFLTANA